MSKSTEIHSAPAAHNSALEFTRRALGSLTFSAISCLGLTKQGLGSDSLTGVAEAFPYWPKHSRRNVRVLGREVGYLEVGKGRPVVFLPGFPLGPIPSNEAFAFNELTARFLAPEFLVQARDDPTESIFSRFVNCVRYVDAWFDALHLTGDVTLILNDWGAVLGTYLARRHSHQIKAIAYIDPIIALPQWDMFAQRLPTMSAADRSFFEHNARWLEATKLPKLLVTNESHQVVSDCLFSFLRETA